MFQWEEQSPMNHVKFLKFVNKKELNAYLKSGTTHMGDSHVVGKFRQGRETEILPSSILYEYKLLSRLQVKYTQFPLICSEEISSRHERA